MIHRLLYDPIESLVYMIIRHQWGCVLGKINNSNRADVLTTTYFASIRHKISF